MSSSARPETTLTSAGDAPVGITPRGLALAWLYPLRAAPALALDFESGEERVIGREQGVAVQLSDPNVSRRHATVRREGDDFFLLDLGSHNGTRHNGKLTKSARLARHDVVRVADCVGLVTDAPGEPRLLAEGLLGGPLLAAELDAARRVAGSALPIILEGETGTGKEVVARAIHAWSGRSGAFVAVNCAALPEALAEGELFGYRRGAFTGADRASEGFFRRADGGTLLLDEVVDLPLVIQAKLLRVLEQREVQPLGEPQAVLVDTRVIVAAQAPLQAAVGKQTFRADLLARLEGVTVRLPPLRERPGDVPALFQQVFAAENGGVGAVLEAGLVERLCLYDWPFNVREVVLLARRLQILCEPRAVLRARDLPPRMRVGLEPAASAGLPAEAAEKVEEESDELRALLSALRACDGNVAQAAAALGVSRQRAYRLMQGHDVDIEGVRRELQERGRS
jgi:transcriptional regulator with GAF, ATPase, and Fis domain